MPPANISFRKRSPKRFILPALVVLALVGGGLFLVGSGDDDAGQPKKPEETPVVAFKLTGFTAYAEGKPAPKEAADQEKQAVVDLLNEYYQTAFVDPKAWSDPAFPTLAAKFAPGAKATFTRDVAALTIGEGRTEFARVEPRTAEMKLSLYYDPKTQPQYAIASVTFRARATTKAKRPVDIVHDATYRFERTPQGWLIFSYDASAKQDTPPSPSPSPTGSPSP